MWGGEDSRSGPGSSLELGVPWAKQLRSIIAEFNVSATHPVKQVFGMSTSANVCLQISSVADIPCGDANWVFAAKNLNTIGAYFGGDMACTALALIHMDVLLFACGL